MRGTRDLHEEDPGAFLCLWQWAEAGGSPQKGGGLETEALMDGPGAEAPRAEEGGDEVAPTTLWDGESHFIEGGYHDESET